MDVLIYIDGQRLDLYESDNISINLSKQNVNDVSKVFADFSQSFSVPASDNNNSIFKHYYDATVDSGFDARVRKDGIILINGSDFRVGKIQLNGVKIKDNQPKAYQIQFFGSTINIKEDVGDDKLIDLDWLSNFNHDYTDANVKSGLTSGLNFTVDGETYNAAIIYPLISYNRQYMYDSDPTDATSNDKLVNIAYDAARTDGVRYDNLKPAIKLYLLIEAINKKYTNFNFLNGFLDTPIFKEIYFNINNNVDALDTGIIEYENRTGTVEPYSSIFNTPYDLGYETTITPRTGFENVPYKVKLYINDNVVYESVNGISGVNSVNGRTIIRPPNLGDDYTARAEVLTSVDFEFDYTTRFFLEFAAFGFDYTIYTDSGTNQVIDLFVRILDLMPDIKVIDLLTSIIKMFNLTIEENGQNLQFQDLINWYASGDIYDITEYVDTEQEEVKKGKIYNELDFKFEESEQILAAQYLKDNRIVYGNLEQRLYEDAAQTTLLNGETLSVEVLFENPIFERIFDQNDNSQTSIQYCPYIDDKLDSITGNPFLFYANVVNISSNPVGFVNSDTTYQDIGTSIIMPTHSRFINQNSFNLNFNAVVNEYTYEVYQDTLYDRFYSDYITDIFSIKRRMFNYVSILPDSLLQALKLNDRLIIKGKRYIINKINSNLINRKDKLELINDIYDAPLASDLLNTSTFRFASQTVSKSAQTNTNTYFGLSGKTISLVDTGDGTSWITLNTTVTDNVVFEVSYDVTTNSSISSRSAQIQVTDGLNNPKFTIIQSANALTVDNNIITVDNTNITSDNG